MTTRLIGQCCMSGPGSHRVTGRLSRVTASILPAAVLMLLPKCPLCLAAWLTLATGVSFSAAGAVWVRGGIVLLWVAAVAAMMWRRVARRAPEQGPSGRYNSASCRIGSGRLWHG